MENDVPISSFVFLSMRGPGLPAAIRDGVLVVSDKCKYTPKGTFTRSGMIAQDDRISYEFDELAEAIEFVRNLIAGYDDISDIQFVVHFPFEPQGNWGFSHEEISGMADLGADLAVTALA